ncbi:MAG: PQQ-dependent sugar dehydrogenase [Limisphaerales bacterium]
MSPVALLMLLCIGSAILPCWGQNPPPPRAVVSSPALARLPGTEAYRRFALLHEGDSFRGKALFADDQKVACSKCHTVDGTAAKAGPDLFAVGDKFGRRDIIESVLAPSAIIAVGYSSTTVETKSGDDYTGIIKQVADTWIELMGADAKRVRIPVADIAERRTSEISLMPEGLQTGLTLQEFTDLIEYLVSLKQATSAAMVEHGMPGVIQALAKPVELRPFITEELKFEHPVWFGPVPAEPGVFLVVEHETGKIWRLEKRAGGDSKTLFLDTGTYQKGTRGLLGMVLHPQFRENRKYYFAKHLVEHGQFATIVFEGEAAPDLKADSGKPPRRILKLDAVTGVHYGGCLRFGPDGYCYIGMGDTGPQEDPQGHGQNTQLLLGKMLRIDVDHPAGGKPYAVPPDNPFVGRADFRPEIWAYGFREPWRFSFDPRTGDLWVGDVGQDRYEEVDIVRRGENYGWNVYEGFEPFSNRYRRPGETYVPPVFAYGRKYGVSVTGGFVYRADRRSSFYGVYIFGDYQSQRLFGLTHNHRVLKTIRQIGTAPQRVVSFGCDARGELYVVGYDGMIYQLNFRDAVFH